MWGTFNIQLLYILQNAQDLNNELITGFHINTNVNIRAI